MPEAPAVILRRLGLRARKRLSQSFLTDEAVSRQMADTAVLGSNDDVLEIGPGLGILTRVLLARARRVVAVELDPVLANHLPELAPGAQLEVIQGDALQVDVNRLFESKYKLLANLPYQITSPVLSRFLVDVRQPELIVIMLQREVAERIAAPPGRASYLSILVQALAEVSLVRGVPAGAFFPRPKVDSAVLRIQPRVAGPLPDALVPDFLKLVRAGFTQPRKTVANSLALGLAAPRAGIETRLAAAGIDARSRAQHLTVADWVNLLRTENA